MFIEINNILINVNNIAKIYYRIFDSTPSKPEFVIYIYTTDGNISKLNFTIKEEFERTWEWIRDAVLR